ncbi:MAG: GDP-mannose 4,6-dehydratase [Caulobacteraceae bacterium]|nr:GDP-mannose 4,6-dehydratase [Caulobacteraceae bacterium]
MRILVTGTAGFIGFHLARRLVAEGHEVTGVDGMTRYYDVRLKQARHAILKRHNGFSERILMLEDMESLTRAADRHEPEMIVHLAAQAGVRYSLENPRAYVDSNLVGAFNVMELARASRVRHLLLASTSSVYGANEVMPFVETERADHPLTFYAATKKATEQMTHAYSHLWDLPTTVFRFFSVYGPWGRPDMALFKFVEGILNDRPIDVYNNGAMARDFTYIDDLIEAIVRLAAVTPKRGQRAGGAVDSLSPVAAWRIVNIGRGEPVDLMDFIAEIEEALSRKAQFHFMPMQPGDVARTFADATLLEALTGYRPATSVRQGVAAFCDWYKSYHGLA